MYIYWKEKEENSKILFKYLSKFIIKIKQTKIIYLKELLFIV